MTDTDTSAEPVERFMHGLFVRSRDYDALAAERDALKTERDRALEWRDHDRERAIAAEAEVARLRGALTMIERIYYIEDKHAGWRAAHMMGVADRAQSDGDLAQYRRLFPRAALQEDKP